MWYFNSYLMDITSCFGVSAIVISILVPHIKDYFSRSVIFKLWIILVSLLFLFFFPLDILLINTLAVLVQHMFSHE